MIKTKILFLLLISNICFGQSNYKETIAETIKNYNHTKIDSLARTIGYKGGDIVKTSVAFKVDYQGKTFAVNATGPHDIFIKESEKIVKSFPVLFFETKLEKGKHFMFNLPISFEIESERAYKKRMKKEKRN
tara:strand:+ start:2344 stop:2739 length:396 start_codon:yes stop_codon:yes gene_type:complete